MAAGDKNKTITKNWVCPTCKSRLKKRRTRKPDACEMVCGGCGEIFDVCNLKTVQRLHHLPDQA